MNKEVRWRRDRRAEVFAPALLLVAAAGLAAGWGFGTWSTTGLERADCARRIAEVRAEPPRCWQVKAGECRFELWVPPDLGTDPAVSRQAASAVATAEKETPP